jgi:hypothetical protein
LADPSDGALVERCDRAQLLRAQRRAVYYRRRVELAVLRLADGHVALAPPLPHGAPAARQQQSLRHLMRWIGAERRAGAARRARLRHAAAPRAAENEAAAGAEGDGETEESATGVDADDGTASRCWSRESLRPAGGAR